MSGKPGKSRKQPDLDTVPDALPDSVVSRIATLVQEAAFRRACAALLQDPPVSSTDDVVSALCLLHPGPPTDESVGLGSLRRVAARAAPTAEVDQVLQGRSLVPVYFGEPDGRVFGLRTSVRQYVLRRRTCS